MSSQEIRCYIDQRFANLGVGIMAACFAVMAFSSMLVGHFVQTLPMTASIFVMLWLLWFVLRRGTFIAIDVKNATLFGSAIFLKSKPIPIKSILKVHAGHAFLGGWTILQVTFIKPDGAQKTVQLGAKETLNKIDFQRLLDELSRLGSHLHIPAELRKQS